MKIPEEAVEAMRRNYATPVAGLLVAAPFIIRQVLDDLAAEIDSEWEQMVQGVTDQDFVSGVDNFYSKVQYTIDKAQEEL